MEGPRNRSLTKPSEKPRNPPVDFYRASGSTWLSLLISGSPGTLGSRGGFTANTCRPNSPCHHEITDTGPGRGRLRRRRAGERLRRENACRRKCLTVSEGNVVCQGCAHVCVCVSVIYASHTLGLPAEASEGSHGRGNVGRPCKPRLEQVYSTEAPPRRPHQRNMLLARQDKLHSPPKNKLTLPLRRAVASAQRSQWDVCCGRRIGGSRALITHLVLFVFIGLPYFIIQSEPRLATFYP